MLYVNTKGLSGAAAPPRQQKTVINSVDSDDFFNFNSPPLPHIPGCRHSPDEKGDSPRPELKLEGVRSGDSVVSDGLLDSWGMNAIGPLERSNPSEGSASGPKLQLEGLPYLPTQMTPVKEEDAPQEAKNKGKDSTSPCAKAHSGAQREPEPALPNISLDLSPKTNLCISPEVTTRSKPSPGLPDFSGIGPLSEDSVLLHMGAAEFANSRTPDKNSPSQYFTTSKAGGWRIDPSFNFKLSPQQSTLSSVAGIGEDEHADSPHALTLDSSTPWVEAPLVTSLSSLSLRPKGLEALRRESAHLANELALQPQSQFPVLDFEKDDELLMGMGGGEPLEKKKRRKYRRTKDCDLPKKPKTPYTFFQLSVMEETWAEVEANNPVGESRESLSRIVARVTGQRWRSMPVEERKIFTDLAARDSERYKKECVEYAKKNGIADTTQLGKLLKAKNAAGEFPERKDIRCLVDEQKLRSLATTAFDMTPFLDGPQLPLEILEVWRIQLEAGVDPLMACNLAQFRPPPE